MGKVLILINTLFLILCSNLSLRDEITATQNIEIEIRISQIIIMKLVKRGL